MRKFGVWGLFLCVHPPFFVINSNLEYENTTGHRKVVSNGKAEPNLTYLLLLRQHQRVTAPSSNTNDFSPRKAVAHSQISDCSLVVGEGVVIAQGLEGGLG